MYFWCVRNDVRCLPQLDRSGKRLTFLIVWLTDHINIHGCRCGIMAIAAGVQSKMWPCMPRGTYPPPLRLSDSAQNLNLNSFTT